jgi:hypothetical protein
MVLLVSLLTYPEASWFCIQCLTRLTQGLAISLLELNTLGHALCMLIIYVLWWNKPLDIEEPEVRVIRDESENEVIYKTLAYMCLESELDTNVPTYSYRYSIYRQDYGFQIVPYILAGSTPGLWRKRTLATS